MSDREHTGRRADGLWQLGVRRTAPLPLDFVWESLVADPAALLGVPVRLEVGAEGQADGVDVRVRSLTPRVVTRLAWCEEDWVGASTLQLRVLPAATGTTVSIAHEALPDEAARARLLPVWTDRLEGWLAALDAPAGS
ncbi:hypothetical protein ACT8ZV_15960 [Nocardioides sp. MAHUQ-72]|uniref:hypothetical protein n=1 Tax=unclassified Nocardioides TaxID=2615069 RepID=UPI00360D7F8A